MFKFWYKNFSHIPVHHPDFHRVQLIYHLLLFVCILAGVVAALNIFLLDAGLIAVIDTLGFLLALGIYSYFRHSGNVAVAGWAVTLIFIAVLSAYLTVWGGNNFGIIWATVIPPIAFFYWAEVLERCYPYYFSVMPLILSMAMFKQACVISCRWVAFLMWSKC